MVRVGFWAVHVAYCLRTSKEEAIMKHIHMLSSVSRSIIFRNPLREKIKTLLEGLKNQQQISKRTDKSAREKEREVMFARAMELCANTIQQEAVKYLFDENPHQKEDTKKVLRFLETEGVIDPMFRKLLHFI